MAKSKQRQQEVFAKIAAVNTVLERYPVLTTTDPMLTNFSINTSIGFILSLLEVFGISQTDIVYWLCSLISDKDGGILEPIEFAIKGILMANVKGVFSCSFNPVLPDNLMKYVVDDGSGRQDPGADFPYDPEKKNCITINLQSVDLFGLLANCPSNKKGGIFYFDAFDPATETVIGTQDNPITVYAPHYIPSELYKSRDFNAFLWYVINKGNIGSHSDLQKNTWDNRNKVYRKYEGNEVVKNNFFKTVTGAYANKPRVPIFDDTDPNHQYHVLDKEQYIICQYNEHGRNQAYSNVLNVWLNADRYYRTRKVRVPVGGGEYHEFAVNKTVFEFNYDYIYSLKLFDTKTLVANIINSILGLASSLSASFSVEQKEVQKKVEAMVENIMREDDADVSDDCFYKFDNTAYQQMIDEVTKSYTGSYTDTMSVSYGEFDDVYEAIADIGSNTEKSGQAQLIEKAINAASNKTQANGETTGTVSEANFMLGADFITNFVKQTVVQIVLQVLSPKIGVLFAINAQLLGGVDELTDWENFMKNFDNLIRNIVVSVKDIIVKELYKFMMDQLSPLLELLISKLAMETIKYYKELITNLILNCIPRISFGTNSVSIDNVNYADIVANTGGEAEQKTPELPC